MIFYRPQSCYLCLKSFISSFAIFYFFQLSCCCLGPVLNPKGKSIYYFTVMCGVGCGFSWVPSRGWGGGARLFLVRRCVLLPTLVGMLPGLWGCCLDRDTSFVLGSFTW